MACTGSGAGQTAPRGPWRGRGTHTDVAHEWAAGGGRPHRAAGHDALLPQADAPLTVSGRLVHRHGAYVHSHAYRGAHRHVLRPCRSQPLSDPARRVHHDDHAHGHSHGLLDDSIKRSRGGVRAVSLALLVLGAAAAGQVVVFALSGSIAPLADLIHNVGDASTAIPVGIAFALRSARAERWAGLAVVLAIFVSACVPRYEAVERLIEPADVTNLGALAAAGAIG